MILLLILLLPLLNALITLTGPKQGATRFATVLALLELAATLVVYFLFREGNHPEMFTLDIPWIESPNVHFRLSLDGISMLMIGLTNISIPFILLSSNNREFYRPRSFFFLIQIMQFALVGVFLADDGLLYYVFWELTLIPAYFILLYWGGKTRKKVTLKFFLYTLAGSLCMMLGFIYLFYTMGGVEALSTGTLYAADFNSNEETWLFLAFIFAFAIKIPIIPFHTWQADTYHVAPAQGTMLLSGLMAKMGLFSIVKWCIPVFPNAVVTLGPWVIALCITGIIYGSIIAIWQRDIKRLFAYASLAHMGLMTAGIFALTANGIEGAMVQAFSHGINTIGLFICADIIYSRMKTHDFRVLGGIRQKAPVFSTCFMVIVIGTIALPFTNSFVGELVTLYGIFEYNPLLSGLAALSLVFGAIYMLRMFKRAMLGETRPGTEHFHDLTTSEKWVLFPIVMMIFLFGIWYRPFFDLTGPAIHSILLHAITPQ